MLLALACAAPGAPARPHHRERSVQRSSFDFYLLALTLESMFCQQGHAAGAQCRAFDAAEFARTPLPMHGLWPENLTPNTWPHDCGGPRLELDASLRAELVRWMPGAREGLEIHEWRKHGSCTGLAPAQYFSAAIDATRRVNEVLGPAIRAAAGRRVGADGLRRAADAAERGFGDSVVFMCHNLRGGARAAGNVPHLAEVHVCLAADGPNGAPGRLQSCAALGRRDERCGREFWIDAP